MPIFTPKSEPKAGPRAAASTIQPLMSQHTATLPTNSALTSMGAYHYAHDPLQRRTMCASATSAPETTQSDASWTGGMLGSCLPVNLQSGIQALSGLSLDNVKVHYNSPKPVQLNALAYAQGSDIHLAPGQEKHLPHEAWHVVQQMQGRVRPTLQCKDNIAINDDAGLEREADRMGDRAVAHAGRDDGAHEGHELAWSCTSDDVIQRVVNYQYISNSQYIADVEDVPSFDLEESSSLDIAQHSIDSGNGVAYIVNSIVSYRELGSLSEVINAILDGLNESDMERLAIVIGVNAPEEEAEVMARAIEEASDVIQQYPFAIALVPQTFGGKKFPFGTMRNAVLHSDETRRMTEYFVHLGMHPYISVQDFDTGSRRVGSMEGPHIFHAIDQALTPLPEDEIPEEESDIRMEVGMEGSHILPAMDQGLAHLPDDEAWEGEDESHMEAGDDGQRAFDFLPLMIGGGYRAVNSELLHARTKARLNKQGVEVSDEKLAKHLEEFTPEIEKDMAYREQYARLHPLLPYAPEPNLFLDATAALRGSPRGTQLLFGEGGAEFTEMAKNVSRFAADELEHHFTERYEQGRGELRELGILEPDPEYSRLLEDVRTEMSIAAQNNRHPVRDIGVLADYSGLNVETDLSRIAATAYVNPRAAQSHAGLTTVVDRFFNTKGDKSKSGASKARDDFSKSLGKIPELSKLDPFDKKLGPGAFGLGGKMSEALSYPFSKGSLFSGMQFGVQSDQKKPFLFQTAIESARRAYFDEQAQNHVALIQNFRDNALPLHGQPGTRLRLQHWTKADGDCGIYSLGYLAGNQSLTRAGLAEGLRSMNTQAAWNAANGISGFNAGLWLSIQQLVTIAGLLGMGDIAIVTLNPAQNTWGVLHGDPTTATHIIGGVPAGVGGAINHWVVLRRE